MLSTTTRALKRSLRTVSYRQTIPSPTLLTRSFAHSVLHFQDQRPPPPPPTPATEPPTKHAIGKIQRRLQITFTCTAPAPTPSHADEPVTMLASSSTDPTICGHRSTHEFSKTAYEKGIVLVECPSCKNRHLIADNLSWFSSTPSPAHPDGLPIGTKGDAAKRTIEDLMKEKGEKVKWLDGGEQGGTWVLEG